MRRRVHTSNLLLGTEINQPFGGPRGHQGTRICQASGHVQVNTHTICTVALGGLVVSVLAIGPKVRRFKRDRGV
jgi:hypothetical protein